MDTEKPLLVSLNGKFYNISSFARKHPGGEKVLRIVAGEDIQQYLDGNEGVLSVRHEHSKSAYSILERYSLDKKASKDDILDSKSGILWRVGDLKQNYWQWIHEPHDGTLRLFNSNFLENLTRTPWWLIPIVWMPLVTLFAFNGLQDFCRDYGMTKGVGIASVTFVIGTLAWTLLEYSLHRGVFHWQPNLQSYRQITLHFLIHGLHHKTPMDGGRLVFPPTAAALFVAIFYAFYRAILPWSWFCCFASGKLFGYVCYDMIHYYLHHGSPQPLTDMHFRKVYHHNHHFKDVDLAFGISTMIWDRAFDTVGAGPLV